MYKSILVGIDLSPKSCKSLEVAVEFAHLFNSKITLLNVHEEFLNKDEMVMSRVSVEEIKKNNEEIALNTKRMFKDMLSKLDINDLSDIEIVQREGKASQEIIEYADKNNIDFIIVGSNGHSALEELFLGSTAKKIINTSKIPVLVVPLLD